MSKVVLAVLAVCVVGAAVAVLSQFTDPLPEAVHVGAPAPVPPATDGGASFAGDWKRALASVERDDESALWEVVRRWIAQDGRAVMDAVAALEGRWERKAWALSLWLESAPAEALAWTGEQGADGERLQVAAVEVLASRDPASAVAVAGRLDGPPRLDAAKAALRVWAGIDPTAAWRAAQEVSVAFAPLSSSLAGLLELYERPGAIPPDKLREVLRAGLVELQERPGATPLYKLREELLAGMFELHERTVRRRALSLAVLDVWAESGSLREPLDAVASTPDANVPSRWVDVVLARWAESAPQDALAWASSLPARIDGEVPLLRSEALGATLAAMAVHWPNMAKQAMEEIGDWQNRDRQRIYNAGGYREGIRRFADTTDPRRVVAWFENHPDESLRRRHSDDVARAYARAHPEEAVAWARALPLGQRTDAVWAALNVVTGEASDRIAAMLLDFGDAELLRMSQDRLTATWAQVDPVAALQWKEAHFPEMKARERMGTFNVWAVYDPVAAAAHVDSLADPEERAWAAWHVIDGTFTGASQRGRKGIVEHIPMIERLYADLPPARRSKHVAYFLYRHFEHSDPQRAARYKVEAGDDHGKPWDFYPPD